MLMASSNFWGAIMHYLITHLSAGHRLIDYCEAAADLIPQITTLLNDNADQVPVVLNDAALRSAYEVDGFGIPVQGADGFLVQLSV